MASSVALTERTVDKNGMQKIKAVMTSHTDGVVTGVAATAYFSGKVERLITVPSGGGTAPTALYDVTVLDDDGVDVLAGAGADRSGTVTEEVLASSLAVCAGSKLTFGATNMGSGKVATVYLYLR